MRSNLLALGLVLLLWPALTLGGITCLTDDVLLAANEASFDCADTTCTFTFWVNHTASPNNSGVFEKSATGDGYTIRTTTTNNSIRVLIKDSAGQNVNARNGSTAINTGAWVHVGIVLTTVTTDDAGNTMTIYLNGVVAQDAPVPISALGYDPNNDPLQICKSSASVFFAGSLDNITVYSGDIGAARMRQEAAGKLRHARSGGTRIAYWPLDQCTHGAAVNGIGFVDRSGNGNTLTADDGANNTGMTCHSGAGLMEAGVW